MFSLCSASSSTIVTLVSPSFVFFNQDEVYVLSRPRTLNRDHISKAAWKALYIHKCSILPLTLTASLERTTPYQKVMVCSSASGRFSAFTHFVAHLDMLLWLRVVVASFRLDCCLQRQWYEHLQRWQEYQAADTAGKQRFTTLLATQGYTTHNYLGTKQVDFLIAQRTNSQCNHCSGTLKTPKQKHAQDDDVLSVGCENVKILKGI